MKPTPDLIDNRRQLNQVLGILLLAAGAFSIVALLTYHGTDRPFFFRSAAAGAITRNMFGRAGATVSEALLQTLGVSSLLFSILCAWLGWDRIRRWDNPVLGRVAAYGVIILALCSLLDLFFGSVALRGSGLLSAGGGGWSDFFPQQPHSRARASRIQMPAATMTPMKIQW